MRASTVFAIALALLIGLAAAAVAKYAGLFDRKDVAAPVVQGPPPVRALVPLVTLYKEIAITSDLVTVIDLPPDVQVRMQQAHGDRWQDKLLPAMPSAAHLRVTRRTLPAGQPLLREDFEDPDLPEALTGQLEAGMRAVNVIVPKDKASGGVIRKGEHVDVFMTSRVGVGGGEEFRTACIARGCKVVMKRNNPWTIMGSDPDDKPLHFTLQANPYRAALIEYAQTRGQLSLMPVPAVSTGELLGGEFEADRQRGEAVARGELFISDEDLRRIFNLPRPVATIPPPGPHVVQHLSGVSYAGQTVLQPRQVRTQPTAGGVSPAGGTGAAPAGGVQPAGGTETPGDETTGAAAGGYNFRLPSATGDTGGSGSGCATCDEERRRKAAEAARAAEEAKYPRISPR